ncbi:MAG: hypothetical protein Q9M29_00910 [Mariprofundaceae bacterium]|nr:hypothetical protein [Mariprofundaceae bacterium]
MSYHSGTWPWQAASVTTSGLPVNMALHMALQTVREKTRLKD